MKTRLILHIDHPKTDSFYGFTNTSEEILSFEQNVKECFDSIQQFMDGIKKRGGGNGVLECKKGFASVSWMMPLKLR